MSHEVTKAAAVQSFALGTDSKSVLTAIPLLCGPIMYSINENYSFAVVDPTLQTITVKTIVIADSGVYTATF